MIRFLKINLGRGRQVQNLLMHVAAEKDVDVLIISEQYRKSQTGSWFEDRTSRAAIMVRNNTLNIQDIGEQKSCFVWVEIEGIRVYSCYFSPNEEHDNFIQALANLEDDLRSTKGQVLVSGDFICTALEWGSRKTDSRGLALLDTMARLDLVILNEGNTFTFRRGDTGSVLDVTMTSGGIAARTTGWIVSEDITLSNHQYIEFTIRRQSPSSGERPAMGKNQGGWVLSKLDKSKLKSFLVDAQEIRTPNLSEAGSTFETFVEKAVQIITTACNAGMPRRKCGKRRTPAYWWTQEIAELLRKCLADRRRATRNRRNTTLVLEYKISRKTPRRVIKCSIRRCRLELCWQVENDHGDCLTGSSLKNWQSGQKHRDYPILTE